MKKLIPLLFLALLPGGSCTTNNNPSPTPVPTVVPPPHPTPSADAAPPPDVCQAQCDNEKRLACPEWRPKCVDDCRTADWNLQKIGSAPLNHACVAAAKDCEAARHCR